MTDDKRKGEQAIPDNVEDYLNLFQRDTLGEIKENGWSLKFVRRTEGEQLTIVLENIIGHEIAVLEEDGEINYDPGIMLREEKELH